MLNKIRETVSAYLQTNRDVLDVKQIADLNAQLAYIESLENDFYELTDRRIEKETEVAKRALFKVLSEKKTEDIEVSRQEFLDIYGLAMDSLGSDNCELYGNDVTVHWHGIYCNCTDGAVAYNNIIARIENVIEEEGE